jgi:hypothetical protein
VFHGLMKRVAWASDFASLGKGKMCGEGKADPSGTIPGRLAASSTEKTSSLMSTLLVSAGNGARCRVSLLIPAPGAT